jgi:protein involved in polysaccharide export with SLBB domain
MAATLLGVAAAFLVGCGSRRDVLKTEVQSASRFTEAQIPADYVIRPGDQLDIKFFFNPELNETVVVRPDGKISLQLIDEVRAAGLTTSELDETLTQMYAQELRRPVIAVIVKSFTGQQVYVGGEVEKPGLVNLTAGMTALQAVVQAEGFKETAKPEGVIVIRKGHDSRPIPIRVDLGQVIDGESEAKDLMLQASDIVYVPKTWIAEANKFVNQYIERLLLYRGVSLGYGF